MNKTALCIKMLILLQSRGQMSSKELAEALETNPRNIREYKNELSTAGYMIREKRGRGGGYYLDEDTIFPSTVLTKEEQDAMIEARNFLKSRPEFTGLKALNEGMDKVISHSKSSTNAKKYVPSPLVSTSKMDRLIHLASSCIDRQQMMEITYQSLQEDKPESYLIDPYEIVVFQQNFYLVAYSRKRNAFRIYRFSDSRMYDLKASDKTFQRDSDFKLEDYIGERSVFKGMLEKYVLKVSKSMVRLFLEQYWGSDLSIEKEEKEAVYYSFYSDQSIELEKKVFSFGNNIQIMEPESFKKQFLKKVKEIKKLYDKN